MNQNSSSHENFIDLKITENRAIDFLLHAFEGHAGKRSDLNIFGNLLYGESYLMNWKNYTGCYCIRNFLPKDIGLEIIGKPGEIDILLIPFDNKEVFYDKASAFEVKIAKPDIDRMYKGANSDGYTQTMGLVKAGFPYVGLVHVVCSKPIPDEVKQEIPFYKPAKGEVVSKDGSYKKGEPEMIKWDWLPTHSESVQMKRLLTYDFPKYVGLKVLSINFLANGGYVMGQSFDWKDFEVGYLNPHHKKETIQLIKQHHLESESAFRKILFNFP